MATSKLEKDLNTLAKKLGFGAVVSYSKMHGTVMNTFGKRSASMWFFTIAINDAEQVVGIEINSTYFKHTPQTTLLKQTATFDTPINFEQAITLVS